MLKPDTFRRVEDLANALATSPVWIAAILGRLGVDIREPSEYDATRVCQVLEALAKQARPSSLTDVTLPVAQAQLMENCRRRLVTRLHQKGLSVVRRSGSRGARMTVRRPDDTEFALMSYVALRKKPTGQVGFTVSYLGDENLSWFAFVVEPWGCIYLKSRAEILSAGRAVPSNIPKSKSITLGRNSATALLENRIAELLAG